MTRYVLEVDHQPRPVKKSHATSWGVALPLLGIWRWRLTGGRKASPSALRTGDKSLALALGTNLARSNDNPGFIAGLASTFACGTCHLSLPAATRTFHFVFTHRHPSFQPESLVNRDLQCSIGCLRRQIICDSSHVYYPAGHSDLQEPCCNQLIHAGWHHVHKRLHRGLLFINQCIKYFP